MTSPAEAQNNRTAELMQRFNEAFLKRSPEMLDQLIADDCVIENTTAAPAGDRYVGKEACLELWQKIALNVGARFVPESIEASGDRALIFWRLIWGHGETDWVRGVNIMRVRDGRIVEALGYVKK